MARIYLDNAATSWPKPETVYAACDRYLRQLGAPVGRSAYRHAAEVEQIVQSARRRLAQRLHAPGPERIVFTFNGTDALNLAIHGLLRPGDHVVTTVTEHNSVLRPLRELQRRHGVQVTLVPCDGQGRVAADEFARALRDQTRLAVLCHASNVTGALQPAAEIAAACRQAGIPLLLDAAQSAGHVPIDVQAMQLDLVAAPGHKGLLGPLGTGFLYIRPGLEDQLLSLRQGGTGSVSQQDMQPDWLPDKYESGNHNAPGLVGLAAALEFLEAQGDQHRQGEVELTRHLLAGLSEIPGIRVYGPADDPTARVGVVSFTLPGYDPQELAAMLDAAAGIQVRAGLHCAPRMHEALGTLEGGGTVRISLGLFNTQQHVEAALETVRQFAASGGC